MSWDNVKSTLSNVNPLAKIGEKLNNIAAAAVSKIVGVLPNWIYKLVEPFLPEEFKKGSQPSSGDLEEIQVTATKKSDAEIASDILQEIEAPARAKKFVTEKSANDWLVDMGYLDKDDPRIKPAAETGAITGLAQESVTLADEMRLENERLQNSRAEQQGPTRDAGNMVVADNSVSNVTNLTQVMSGPQPPVTDYTDPYLAFTR